MKQKLNQLLKYVQHGTAEGDHRFLKTAFIENSDWVSINETEPGDFKIITGNKGVGKSAILRQIRTVCEARSIPCLYLTPTDFFYEKEITSTDLGSINRYYYSVIENTTRNLLEVSPKPVSLSTKIALVTTKSPISGMAPEEPATLTEKYYLLFDDIDHITNSGNLSQLNKIWGFLLAIRKYVENNPGVTIFVALRTSVWIRMTTESQGQRDQTDHFRGSIISIGSSELHNKTIVRKRLDLAALALDTPVPDSYELFFDSIRLMIPNKNEDSYRLWDDFIVTNSRERPRDSLQLLRGLVESAIKRRASVISAVDAENSLPIYSLERVNDVYSEYSIDCKNIREVILTFMDVQFVVEFRDLLDHLKIIPSTGSTVVRGKILNPNSEGDALLMLGLLHEIGFINPRVVDKNKPRGFNHVTFEKNPYFTRGTNKGELYNSTWEIHPAFRSFLKKEKEKAYKPFKI